MPTREQFVKTWQAARNAKAAASALSMTQAAAERRARRYRTRGIPLKAFGDSYTMDVESLAKLARKAAPKGETK